MYKQVQSFYTEHFFMSLGPRCTMTGKKEARLPDRYLTGALV